MAKKKSSNRKTQAAEKQDYFMQYYYNYLFADDITYCGGDCENTQCQRHRSHMPFLTPISISDLAQVCVSYKKGE